MSLLVLLVLVVVDLQPRNWFASDGKTLQRSCFLEEAGTGDVLTLHGTVTVVNATEGAVLRVRCVPHVSFFPAQHVARPGQRLTFVAAPATVSKKNKGDKKTSSKNQKKKEIGGFTRNALRAVALASLASAAIASAAAARGHEGWTL